MESLINLNKWNNFDEASHDGIFQEKPSLDYQEEFSLNGKKYHRCTFPDCGKIFRFRSEIIRHHVIHFDSRPFCCYYEACKKTFKRMDALENHQRIHTKLMPFECEFPNCQQKFKTKAGLRYHYLKHQNIRSFQCHFSGCDKTFLTYSQLRQHEKASYHSKILKESQQEKKLFGDKEQELKGQDTYPRGFFSPQPKFAQTLQWETKNQSLFDEITETGEQESFERMLKCIIKEDSIFEQKFELCTKLVDTFQQNCGFHGQVNNKLNSINNTSFLCDSSESILLDFLKGEQ